MSAEDRRADTLPAGLDLAAIQERHAPSADAG
jgi:hypothetical protein